MSATDPILVAVWGPGTIGTAAIREIAQLPHLELVGVRAFSDAKAGQDAGELAGLGPLGVSATTRDEDILAAKPDCVVHAPRDIGDWRADDEIVQLLEAGINVVTVLPYQYPRARGDDAHERFDAAGRRGGATLYGTGINPGFMFERLAMAATGLSNGVKHVQLNEYVNVEHITGTAEFLGAMGFGMATAEPAAVEMVAGTVGNYLTPYLHSSAEKIGLTVDRIERTDQHLPTPQDLDIPGLFTLKAGTAGLVSFKWTAFCDGEPRLTTQVKWYATDLMRPEEAKDHGDDFWVIEIDGRPSVRLLVEIQGTLDGARTHPDNPTHVSMLSTAIPAIQAIPDVVAADPGVLLAGGPQFHYREPGITGVAAGVSS
jgi:2,4-diaminopentanoate dehydrogenase